MNRSHITLLLLAIIGMFLPGHGMAQDLAGIWAANLYSKDRNIQFLLSLEKDENKKWQAFFVNGTERIEVPDVTIEGKKVNLRLDHYDSELSLKLIPAGDHPRALEGTWKKRRGPNKWVEMKFRAHQNDNWKKGVATTKFDGKWKVKFASSQDPAVGIFKMDPKTKRMNGTFLTTTGDYRYLSGNVIGYDTEKLGKPPANRPVFPLTMHLGCFDGAHAFQFQATLDDASGDSLKGNFWSSDKWHETWTAQRDPKAKLPDDFKQTTQAKNETLHPLVFPDLEGNPTSVADEKFAAPVRLIHVFGSWCPNCQDAGEYLAELDKKYGDKVSVVGLAFELTGDFKRDAGQVKKYLKRHGLKHPVLIAGLSDKAIASKAVPVLDRVRSYPTTIFANQQGDMVAIHTGFSGPATGEAYTQLKAKYESTIEKILDAANGKK